MANPGAGPRGRPRTTLLARLGTAGLAAQLESPARPWHPSPARYGEWVEMPGYGWRWAPRVERRWCLGWVAYHHGCRVNDPYHGWVWVLGTEWAPPWVSWHHGNG